MTASPADIADVAGVVLRIIIALVFIGMGVNHFRAGPARVMASLLPPRLRFDGAWNPLALVYFTGVCEIAGGVGILIPDLRWAAAIGLVLFLIAVFPANAYAAENPEKFGRLAIPFWPRFAAQLVLILAVVLAAIL